MQPVSRTVATANQLWLLKQPCAGADRHWIAILDLCMPHAAGFVDYDNKVDRAVLKERKGSLRIDGLHSMLHSWIFDLLTRYVRWDLWLPDSGKLAGASRCGAGCHDRNKETHEAEAESG